MFLVNCLLSFLTQCLAVKNKATARTGWCQSRDSQPQSHHWLCIISANVNIVQEADNYYENSFDFADPLRTTESHCLEARICYTQWASWKALHGAWHVVNTWEPGWGATRLACIYASGDWEEKYSAYLCEIEDVRVRDCEQSVDCTSEGIDLLVWVPHEDFPTWLRQNYVHDRCDQEDGK